MISRRGFIDMGLYGAGAILLSPLIKKNFSTRQIYDSQSLVQALADTTVQPGDILELDDGVYTGDFVSSTLTGTEQLPIIIKPFHPGKVTIDGSLWINSPWTHWYDLDFTDSRTDRYVYTNSILMYGVGSHLHGCRMTDMHNSGVQWFSSGVGEVSECVIYNNGGRDPDGSGHGHAIYSHNTNGGTRVMARNILGNQLGNYTVHIYSGGANYLKDFVVKNNMICGDPVHTGGGLGLINFLYENNVHYGDYEQHGRYSPDGTNNDGTIRSNNFISMGSYFVNPSWENLVEEFNEVYGGEPSSRAGYTVYPQPATKIWITPFVASARWLGMVTIFNRDSTSYVGVNLSSILPNGNYRLRNGQNMTETWEFIQSGTPIDVPMNIWTPSHVIGEGDGENHLPVFGSFVIERSDSVPTPTSTYIPIITNTPTSTITPTSTPTRTPSPTPTKTPKPHKCNHHFLWWCLDRFFP